MTSPSCRTRLLEMGFCHLQPKCTKPALGPSSAAKPVPWPCAQRAGGALPCLQQGVPSCPRACWSVTVQCLRLHVDSPCSSHSFLLGLMLFRILAVTSNRSPYHISLSKVRGLDSLGSGPKGPRATRILSPSLTSARLSFPLEKASCCPCCGMRNLATISPAGQSHSQTGQSSPGFHASPKERLRLASFGSCAHF